MTSSPSLIPASAAPPADWTGARYYYARRAFDAANGTSGLFRIFADQHAMVWLNGEFLGRTFVHAHEDERRYAEFDLTGKLVDGSNVIALLLHAHGAPEENIPGVVPPDKVSFTATGNAGDVDLGDYAVWKIFPAKEYAPAPRHNSLIGHAEHRDLRLEPIGWCEVGFDDQSWPAPKVEPDSRAFLSVPLRSLTEDIVYPTRLVKQGEWQPGIAFQSLPPTPEHHFWRVKFSVSEPTQTKVFFCHHVQGDITFDGQSVQEKIDPPFIWVEPYWPVALDLAPGSHVLAGNSPGRKMQLGWSVQPEGGDGVEWATSADGPFIPGRNVPERDYRIVTDTIQPGMDRCQLGVDGLLDLEVIDADYSIVLEFDRTFTMLPILEIADATSGAQIEIVYSEAISEYPGLTIGMGYHDEVTLREGAQTYGISFQYKSARVLILNIRARGGRVHLRRVSAIYRRYDYDLTGAFSSSDARLNRVWEISRHTMQAGSQDFIMDGPWREQLLYIGDNYVHNQAAYYLFGNHEIVEWQHTLYALGQMADGIFQPNQPCRTSPEEYRLLDQVLLWPIQLEHHYLYTGGQEFVRELLPNVKRHIEGFQKEFGRRAEGDARLRDLTGWNWIDHPGDDDGVIRSFRHDGIPTGMNVLYLLAIQSAIRLLEWNGEMETAKSYRQLASEISELLRKDHFDPVRGIFADAVVDGKRTSEASLHLNLLAIEADLCDDPNDVLNRTWKQRGVMQICGPFFRVHLLEVLHRLGRFEEMLGEIRELWGGYVDAGLTATPENMPLSGHWTESLGHPWGASPSIFLAKSIAGLAPTTPGWNSMVFSPHLEDLSSLNAAVPTPHGAIRVSLEKRSGKLAGFIEVPRAISWKPDAALSDVEVRTY